ncbi:flagellar basal body-associated FliL family protein [Halopseudomonas nanhaiensis]|uniref:flagellar basal body-associated FliL family protein n=1 Tax=Halopseudomonas nanhaiensis TaxID=2830842 RepID=UPI001CBC5918|nr:flagellar basal body-associated FliL family protein [Halopseudomonas nanhaiensis]UAW99255.1 flagellar basal body-associated FliL family protein [Halopseudomonas nanhaiensis]
MARKQAEAAAAETDAKPAASRKKLFILIGAGVLALLVSIGGVLFFVLSGDSEEPVEEAAAVPAGKPTALYQPLEPAFVVNYTHGGRQRYMQVNVVLMGRDAAGMATLTKHLPLVRNQLVMLFTSEEFDTLFTPDGKETLRQRATLAVQSLLEKEIGNPVIESVLFTNIVLQ